MMRFVLLFFTTLLSLVAAYAGEPFCIIRNYDERDGLSQRLVKQVVQDDSGLLWVATWNGLNRFDGYEFKCIRPSIDDQVRRYSSRIGDIKLGRNGYLWCRIDERVVRFDVGSYDFYDTHCRLEKKFGRNIAVKNISVTIDDDVVIGLKDGKYIILNSSTFPEPDAIMSDTRPDKKFKSLSNRSLGDVGPYRHESLLLSRRDESGTVWLVTRDGDVISAPGLAGPFRKMGHIDASGMGLRYATTDTQGNVWFCSKVGLHRLTIGTAPYTIVSHASPSMLRTSFRDSAGRVWLSWSDAGCLAVYAPDLSSPMYVTRDGSLSPKPEPFGAAVYSITETRPGEIWLGTKPDGLYRLTECADGSYSVSRFINDPADFSTPSGVSYYDGAVDASGRLWLASMGGGIDVVAEPSAARPAFIRLSAFRNYPSQALSVRHICILNDSMAVAATTGGLLAFNIPSSVDDDSMRFVLHVSEPGREMSLGNIATMDVELGDDGVLYVATESDGVAGLVSRLSDGLSAKWDFISYRSLGGLNPDVAHAVQPVGVDSLLLVTSGNDISMLEPYTGETKVYGASFWHRDMIFSDARPLRLADGEWLFGLNDGAVKVKIDSSFMSRDMVYPVTFSAVSISGSPDSLLSVSSDSIVLRPSRRDITLRFAALCYADNSSVSYAFRLGDDEWKMLGTSRSVSFVGLPPGTYTLMVRSTDTHGQWLDNGRSITLVLLPTFWETGWAKALYAVLLLAFIGAVIWIVVYIRRIKRQQREMLESHLRQLEARAAGHNESEGGAASGFISDTLVQSSAERLSHEDRQLMDAVMGYIECNLSNPSVTVDDMAAAVAVSRSGLTRKMKSLMGVTPAEFLRETRLTRASTLLLTTGKPLKEIAADCGFSDMNYFGKCFKAYRGVTPGAYRKNGSSL